jgi:hypothetical protein
MPRGISEAGALTRCGWDRLVTEIGFSLLLAVPVDQAGGQGLRHARGLQATRDQAGMHGGSTTR